MPLSGAASPCSRASPRWNTCTSGAAAICAEHPGDAAAALFNARRGEGNNFRALMDSARLPAGLEGALFGHMVTSDPGANIEAAVHVAHAFTVHREESERDYLSVGDDLQGDDEDAGAVRTFTKTTAIQHATENIRCNSIHSGPVDTPMLANISENPEVLRQGTDEVPLGRLGVSRDIAYGALYLASHEATWITGIELIIDGGITVK